MLKLTDALIIIDIRYCPDDYCVYIAICDSGNGFKTDSEREASLLREHGRGLTLLAEIGEKVVYNASGNQVEICYKLT